MKDKSLIVFQDKKIRRLWHDNAWSYSVTDIIAVLTDSRDEMAYWRKLKQREPQLVTICHGLKLPAKDGKLRYTDCVNTKNAFRLIQSIPSKKAEPFKQWFAQVAKERIEEIENPELAQNRVKEYYELKGYPKLKRTAKEGGNIAKNTRKELEQKIGKSIVSKDNYLSLEKNKKKELKND